MIFVLPLLYATLIVVACCLWKRQEVTSAGYLPSTKMQSLWHAKLGDKEFPLRYIIMEFGNANDAHAKHIHRIREMITLDSLPFSVVLNIGELDLYWHAHIGNWW